VLLRKSTIRLAASFAKGKERTALLNLLARRNDEVVTYKGKSYRLLWSGKTRYGERAKLQFMNGTKEFWVGAELISSGSSGGGQSRNTGRGHPMCEECGTRPAVTTAPDSSGIVGDVCSSCARLPRGQRSYM